MNLNLVVLSGKLAVDSEIKEFDSGSRLVRFLVTVRVEHPRRRVDVVPVTYWPEGNNPLPVGKRGEHIWLAGSIQRRYWESPDGRRSRMEVVAEQVKISSEVNDLVSS